MKSQSQIAPHQKQRLDVVRKTLSAIDSVIDDANRLDFEALSEKLDGWAARVAVIGQVKAGKSTFLNAFLGQHDFLPSDINPWTSVVTNLRINIPNDPETGVSFEFFSEEDWNEIIDGKSAIGELSEELLPGFDADLLREQSKELQEKAQRRLGNHYKTMLGSTHDFNFSSSDLLKRYVCAGPGSDQGLTEEALGRYAALTREANVYMGTDVFQVPTILTDTPGVNDPFLVRDEVTCRALDRSDLFIMVLSAHQALTDIDLGLIRLLSQENDRDVLIYVNRLDEVDQYDERFEQIMDDVSERLEEAIPGNDFTILLGSGFMADAVLQDDAEGQALRDELDTPTLAAYLKAAYGYTPKDQNERLLLGSGLQKISQALSDMIDTGVAHRQVGQLLDDVRAQIAATKYSSANLLDSLKKDISQLQVNDAVSLTQTLGSEMLTMKDAADDIESMVSNAQTQFTGFLDQAQTDLATILNAKVDEFLASQESLIESSLMLEEDQDIPSEPLTIYLGALQREIETAVTEHFAEVRTPLDAKLERLAGFASNRVSEAFEKNFRAVSLENLPNESFSTTLTMAKRSIETGLIGKRSLAFWKKKSINMDKTIQVVKSLATAELTPALKALLQAFRDAQEDRIAGGIERISMAQRVVEHGVTERAQRLKDHNDRMEILGAENGDLSAAVQQLQNQADGLESMYGELSKIEISLDDEPQSQAA